MSHPNQTNLLQHFPTKRGADDTAAPGDDDGAHARPPPSLTGERRRLRRRPSPPEQVGGKTRKWSNIAPKRGKQRTRMLKRCGRKCFLATRKRFPVCAKGTCKVNKKGLRAAYMRARSTGTRSNKLKRKMSPIAKRAKKRLRNFKN